MAYPSEFPKTHIPEEYTYTAASYIKWVEQSGARAMPIPWDLDDAELTQVFSYINGLVIPGGFWNIYEDPANEKGFTPMTAGVVRMLALAKKANDAGDYFPIYGIQQGMELMCAALAADDSGDYKLFDWTFKLENWATNLQYMRNATDHMWSFQRPETIDFTSKNEAVTYYQHYTLSVVRFLRHDTLRDFFDITAMSKDQNGQQFVSAIQAKNYPFFGTQFLAPGNNFEFKRQLHLNHNARTIEFTQSLSNYFVQNARVNAHSYPLEDDEDHLLIYNYVPEKIHNDFYEQVYFFHRAEFKQKLSLTAHKVMQKLREAKNDM